MFLSICLYGSFTNRLYVSIPLSQIAHGDCCGCRIPRTRGNCIKNCSMYRVPPYNSTFFTLFGIRRLFDLHTLRLQVASFVASICYSSQPQITLSRNKRREFASSTVMYPIQFLALWLSVVHIAAQEFQDPFISRKQ